MEPQHEEKGSTKKFYTGLQNIRLGELWRKITEQLIYEVTKCSYVIKGGEDYISTVCKNFCPGHAK